MDIRKPKQLEHLSEEEIETLYQRYIAGEKVQELLREYKIRTTPYHLYKLFPPVLVKEKCNYCDCDMYQYRKSRSDTNNNEPPKQCVNCGHRIYSDTNYGRQETCNCVYCAEQQEKEREVKKQDKIATIHELYNPNDIQPVHLSELTFTDKLNLLSLCYSQTSEDFNNIISLQDKRRVSLFTPTALMDRSVLEILYNDKILIVDPDSDPESFSEENQYESFYINTVDWLVNITVDGESRLELKTIFNLLSNELFNAIQPSWEQELYQLLKIICLEEVMQYLNMKANELGVTHSAETKTREIITQLIDDFSISQLYYFTDLAIKNAHIFYSKGTSKGKRHAGNTIPNKLLNLGTRAKQEDWSDYAYKRDSRAPRSTISQVLFDYILKEPDACFEKSFSSFWDQHIYPQHFADIDSEDERDPYCPECGSLSVKPKVVNHNVKFICHDCEYNFMID